MLGEIERAFIRDIGKLRGVKRVTIIEYTCPPDRLDILIRCAWWARKFDFFALRLRSKIQDVLDKSPYIAIISSDPNPKRPFIIPY